MEQFEQFGYFTLEDGQLSHQVIPQDPKFIQSVVQPKKPPTAYHMYISLETQEYRKKHPDTKAIDVLKVVAE